MKTFGDDQNPLATISERGTPLAQAIEKASLRRSCARAVEVEAVYLIAFASQSEAVEADNGAAEVGLRNTWPQCGRAAVFER